MGVEVDVGGGMTEECAAAVGGDMDVFVGRLLGPVHPDVAFVPPDALDLIGASIVVLGEGDVPGVVPLVLGAVSQQGVGLDEPVGVSRAYRVSWSFQRSR